MDNLDRQWVNIRDRYYTLKPTRKPLYLNEYAIEKDTGHPPALHLMFKEDKIKEEFLYSSKDPTTSLMNGISNPCIIGVVKTGESFYLLVHILPKHPGWHNGTFISNKYDMLFSYREILFIKGQDIMNSISDDVAIKEDLYKRLKMMGDCYSLLKKYDVFHKMSAHMSQQADLVLLLKSLNFEDNKQKKPLKAFIFEIKKYMSKHKDFDFEKGLKNYFIDMYKNNETVALYIYKYLKEELRR